VRQEVRFCIANDGVRLAYATSGHGAVVVKVGHWMTHLERDWTSPVWRHWVEFLSREHTLVRYDERREPGKKVWRPSPRTSRSTTVTMSKLSASTLAASMPAMRSRREPPHAHPSSP